MLPSGSVRVLRPGGAQLPTPVMPSLSLSNSNRRRPRARAGVPATSTASDPATPVARPRVLPCPPEGTFHPPVPFVVPRGYQLGRCGVYREVVESKHDGQVTLVRIAEAPVWITETLIDIDSGQSALTIQMWRGERLSEPRTVGREELSTKSSLVKLSRFGFPFASTNDSAMVRYFQVAEAANQNDKLPHRECAAYNGWRSRGTALQEPNAFVWGRKLFTPDGVFDLTISPAAGSDAVKARRFSQAGTEEGWAETLPLVMKAPVAVTSFLAAYASPLLRILGQQGFLVEHYGTTSKGKSTQLRINRSIMGPAALEDLPSLNTTDFGVEAMCHHSQSCCIEGDELSLVPTVTPQDRERVVKMLYMIAAGVGRTRGTKELVARELMTWTLTGTITGEQSVRRLSTNSGLGLRVISFQGSPRGPVTEESRSDTDRIEAILMSHYGWAGPRLVQTLLRLTTEERARMRDRHASYSLQFRRAAKAGVPAEIVGRLSKSYATMALAGDLLAMHYPEHVTLEDCHGALFTTWAAVLETHVDAGDYAEQAFEQLKAWVVSRAGDIEHPKKYNDDWKALPGKRETLGAHRKEGTAIIGTQLKEFFSGKGIDPSTVYADWIAKEWLLADEEPKTKRQKPRYKAVKINGAAVKCYIFAPGVLAAEEDCRDE